MNKKHLRRLTMPKTWPIMRKKIKYITRPEPGKKFEYSLPISIVLKDIIGLCKTTREVKYVIQNKEVLVDGRRVKEIKYPVGLMDVVSLPETKKNYRIILTAKGKLGVAEIDDKEAAKKIMKIMGKRIVKKKMQLNLLDSRNILVDKGEFSVGGSVSFEVPSQKVLGHYKLEKGSYVLLIAGKYSGHQGTIEEVADNNIIINLTDGKKVETVKRYAFVIGKEKPEIKIE